MGEFRDLVITETPTLSNNAKDRARIQALEANGEIEVLLRTKEATIKIPHTHKASCVLGRGTKWCPTEKDPSAFEQYSAAGNLYVIAIGGEKFQFHFEEGQFMDALDVGCGDEKIKVVLGLMEGVVDKPYFYYQYAKHYGRWGEDSREEIKISDDARLSYYYAKDVLKERWGRVLSLRSWY